MTPILTGKIEHITGVWLFGLIAFFWVFHGLRVAYGALRLPRIKDFAPAGDADCPRISLIFAARDEGEKLPAALVTLAALDYPNLEIIAVNDRSQDSTGALLEEFACRHQRFRVLHVTELPNGWLGKPHALQKAYEASTGEWLLFTDADVRFAPDVLRRAVTLVKQRNVDHLTLFGDVEMVGFWEKVVRGVTKNFFAALGYNVTLVLLAAVAMLLLNVAPFIAVFAGHGWIRVFATIAVAVAMTLHIGVDITMRVSPFYALTHPIGAVIFCYMLLRSTAVTLWRGGVDWRGTFYPLEELKRGLV